MKKLILLLAGICMAFPAFHILDYFTSGRNGMGTSLPVNTKNLGTADVLVSATEYGIGYRPGFLYQYRFLLQSAPLANRYGIYADDSLVW